MAGDEHTGRGDGPPVSAERFEEIVAAYGADPARWPVEERDAAEAYARSVPSAQALLAEAEAVDALLAAVPAPQPSDDLVARILAETPRPAAARETQTPASRQPFWRWLFAGPSLGPIGAGPVLAASICVGLVTGFALPSDWGTGASQGNASYTDTTDDLVLAAFGYQSEEGSLYE